MRIGWGGLGRGSGGSRNPIDDLWYGEVSPDSLDILNRVLPEQPFQDASYEVDHDRVALFPQHGSEPCEDLHSLPINDEARCLRNGSALCLYDLSELRRVLEDRMRRDPFRDVLSSFLLVTDVDEPVVYAHLKLCGCLIYPTLVLVELFQALKGCSRMSQEKAPLMTTELTVHELLLFERNGKSRILAL